MNKTHNLVAFYYALALVNLVATWYYNAQYLLHGGSLAPAEFFGAAFANTLTSAITIDIYLSAVAFSVFVVTDAKRHQVKRPWLYVAVCFAVGLAISLPLYLASREKHLRKRPMPA